MDDYDALQLVEAVNEFLECIELIDIKFNNNGFLDDTDKVYALISYRD